LGQEPQYGKAAPAAWSGDQARGLSVLRKDVCLCYVSCGWGRKRARPFKRGSGPRDGIATGGLSGKGAGCEGSELMDDPAWCEPKETEQSSRVFLLHRPRNISRSPD